MKRLRSLRRERRSMVPTAASGSMTLMRLAVEGGSSYSRSAMAFSRAAGPMGFTRISCTMASSGWP